MTPSKMRMLRLRRESILAQLDMEATEKEIQTLRLLKRIKRMRKQLAAQAEEIARLKNEVESLQASNDTLRSQECRICAGPLQF